jgi:hypothetical protein
LEEVDARLRAKAWEPAEVADFPIRSKSPWEWAAEEDETDSGLMADYQ